ncbi:uncharacterized protein LOC103513646 [Diaphorina citri]|uniref:Uncharacterized protein LOC103513646 n=1 Tax=Diaphorina citri TaxID=121845 RepID=A0A3Q0J270_DIACI|nr:uncharacterized protein LOC103513646 [Diaphorina citri]
MYFRLLINLGIFAMFQIMDALLFLHQTCHFVHRNVCPSSIIVNKKGTWKLAGLDFMAPEIQKESCCSTMSDAYSLGMTIAAIFNSGKSLIQANHSASNHLKQVSLGERVLLSRNGKGSIRDIGKEKSDDPVIQALQFLDVISMKDPATKTVFYKETLIRALPYIPKVRISHPTATKTVFYKETLIRALPYIPKNTRTIIPEVRIPEPLFLRLMLSDKRYGLSVNLMATRVMPSLLPQTVNPQLNLEQFTCLLEVLQEMLDQIDRNQRNKLKLDNMTLPSPERHRPLRHLYSSDNMHVPPFNIPNLRIEQRKTSSAEDMQRKNSTDSGILGGWWYGISPSSPDSNFLRVANALPNMRRLSDNTLMTPKIRIAPSCASSPGGTPGGGLPTRRHSSIGPQERRGSSSVNLSPPTLARSMIGGSMPNTSSSVPFLSFGGGSMQSIRSRRPSQCSNSSLLQQLGSGMVRQLSSSGSPQHPTHANGRTFAGIPANVSD